MEVTAHLRNLRIGPRKVRLLADLVTGRPLADAIAQLDVQTKRAARPLVKLLQSAAANAEHNHKLTKADLLVKRVTVNSALTLTRFTPRAFGRATPVRKRGSHVTVTLVECGGGKAKTRSSKPEARSQKLEAGRQKVVANS